MTTRPCRRRGGVDPGGEDGASGRNDIRFVVESEDGASRGVVGSGSSVIVDDRERKPGGDAGHGW